MPSKASMEFLQRQRIILRPSRGMPHTVGGSASHRRNIKYPAETLPLDTPSSRVLTQKQEDRVPYEGATKEE